MPRRRRPPRPGALQDLAPLRILTQIFLLQAFYYAVGLVLIVFVTFVAGRHPNAGLLLDWRNLRGDVTTGWTLGLCWMLDSLITYVSSRHSLTLDECGVLTTWFECRVIPILLLIARSKLVADFALTIHGVNLVITTLYTRSIPTHAYWWAVQFCSVALMVALGIWACQWRELKPMAFGGASKGKQKATDPASGADDGEGHIMGGGGRGRDGGGAYEMVQMGGPREPA